MHTYWELKDTYKVEPTDIHAKSALDAFCRNNVEKSANGTTFIISHNGKRTEYVLIPPEQQQRDEVNLKRLRFTFISAQVLGNLAIFAMIGLALASTAGSITFPTATAFSITAGVGGVVIAGIFFKILKLKKSVAEQQDLNDLKADLERIQNEGEQKEVAEPVNLRIPAEPPRLFGANKERGYCHITTAEDLNNLHAIDNARSAAERRYLVAAFVIAGIVAALLTVSLVHGQDFTKQFADHSCRAVSLTPLYVAVGTLASAGLAGVALLYLMKKSRNERCEAAAAAWLTWRTAKQLKEIELESKTIDQLHDEFLKMIEDKLRIPGEHKQLLKASIRNKFESLDSFEHDDQCLFVANLWAHYYLAERISRAWDPEGSLRFNTVGFLSLKQCVEQFNPHHDSVEMQELS